MIHSVSTSNIQYRPVTSTEQQMWGWKMPCWWQRIGRTERQQTLWPMCSRLRGCPNSSTKSCRCLCSNPAAAQQNPFISPAQLSLHAAHSSCVCVCLLMDPSSRLMRPVTQHISSHTGLWNMTVGWLESNFVLSLYCHRCLFGSGPDSQFSTSSHLFYCDRLFFLNKAEVNWRTWSDFADRVHLFFTGSWAATTKPSKWSLQSHQLLPGSLAALCLFYTYCIISYSHSPKIFTIVFFVFFRVSRSAKLQDMKKVSSVQCQLSNRSLTCRQ